MSEPMLPPPSASLSDRINDALVAFSFCVGSALEDLCSYGLTVGETYVPFDPDPDDDCEEGEAVCSQAWVRVTDISVVFADKGFDNAPEGCEGDCGGQFSIGLEVGVLRCFEIAEGGEAPTTSEVLVAAMQAMTDSAAIYQAAMNCDVWASIDVGQWVPEGPQGGQVGGTWNFTVELQ